MTEQMTSLRSRNGEGEKTFTSPTKHEVSQSNHSKLEPNTSSKKNSFVANASFHVRISIGCMTGLKIEKIGKRAKQLTNNQITEGFVELFNSGKYSALSQPLETEKEEKEETTKISWGNQLEEEEFSKSKLGRTLHFSLSLDRENNELELRDDNDNNSICTMAEFMPKVVKLLVGLKCGDERIPLGIAKFVVNGREVFEEEMDLIVLPGSSLATGAKTKRRIFGKKQRSSFTNGELAFELTQNAKLRIKADVKMGYTGQDGAEIWGDEDCSYTSTIKKTFGSEYHTFSPDNAPLPTNGLSLLAVKTQPAKEADRNNVPPLKSCLMQSQNHDKKCNSFRNKYSISDNISQLNVNEAPMTYVYVDTSNELVSVISDASRAGCVKSWSCVPLFCGGNDTVFLETQYRKASPRNFLFESNEMMANEIESFNEELRTCNPSSISSLDVLMKTSSK